MAGVIGAAALILIEPHGPDQEHWDNPIYWRFAYPAICIGCGALGFFFRKYAWAYGLIAVWIQGLPAIVANHGAEFIAVSIFLLGLVSIPAVLAGLLGAWVGRRIAPGA